jgi:hypothetical protein
VTSPSSPAGRLADACASLCHDEDDRKARACLLPGRFNLRPIRPEDASRLISPTVSSMCDDQMNDNGGAPAISR